MPTCKFCNQENLDWYEDFRGKWKLGIKIDINNYRPHKCNIQKEESSNKRNWIIFTCLGCGEEIRQNIKLVKSDQMCIECKLKY